MISDDDIPPDEVFAWDDEPLDDTVLDLALDQLAETLHQTSVRKGFYDDANVEDMTFLASKVALIHQEVSELLEAYRQDNPQSDKIPELSLEEEELADIIIRVLDLAAFRGVSIGSALLRKAEYNRGRAYKHGKNL